VVTVLVAIDRLPASTVLEARQACKLLGLTAIDWVSGIPRIAPVVMISGLDHGVRRIPDDLVAVLEATPALRLMLCVQEPLVERRVVIGDGRIAVLGPPTDRSHIAAALRAAIQPPVASERRAGQRFEVLRRSHWVAWARGRSGPAISLHEQRGATVVIGGSSHNRAAIADAMSSSQVDEERESALGVLAGTAGVAHLTPAAAEWVVYWPMDRCPLWIYSPDRIPARWDAARGIAAVASRRLVRFPAFPADQLVAAWSDTPSGGDALAPLHHRMAEGGSETLAGLDELASRNEHITGVVVEVR
jgi:hypothetical protein